MEDTKQKRTFSPEHRAKLSAAFRGKTKSPEHRAKLSASHRGKTKSPETRAKISASNRGKLQVTLTPTERVAVDEAAAANGVPVLTYVRRCLGIIR